MSQPQETPLKPDNAELEAENEATFTDAISDFAAIDAEHRGEPTEADSEPEPAAELDASAAVGTVELGLYMSEAYLAGMTGLPFEYNAEQKAKFLDATGPLIQKHGATWLGWFDQYKEELLFGSAAVGLCFTSYVQLKRLSAERLVQMQKEEAANDAKTKEDDTATAAA